MAAWHVGDVDSSYEGEAMCSVDVQLIVELQYDGQSAVDVCVVNHVGCLNHQRVERRRATQ